MYIPFISSAVSSPEPQQFSPAVIQAHKQPITSEHTEDLALQGNRTKQEVERMANQGKRFSNLEPRS